LGGAWSDTGGTEQQPRHDEGRQVRLVVQVVGGAHGGVRLGAEVLDDDLLHGTELPGDPPDRQERVDPLCRGLADPDEDAGGERHGQRPASSSTRRRTAGSLSGLP
jgi:hypothetical protein